MTALARTTRLWLVVISVCSLVSILVVGAVSSAAAFEISRIFDSNYGASNSEPIEQRIKTAQYLEQGNDRKPMPLTQKLAVDELPQSVSPGDNTFMLSDSNGNNYRVAVTKEDHLQDNWGTQDGIKYLEIDNGNVIAVNDYAGYVQSISQFRDLADEIYLNSNSDYEFIHEVWYTVTNSVKYADEDQDDVSLALETLVAGQGDCEDLTILMASILASSSYTDDWTLEIVYFDAFNPSDSGTANHVALYIQTDQFSTFIESTNSELDGLKVWRNVSGWYVPIPRQ